MLAAGVLALGLAGCISIGHSFEVAKVRQIAVGETTRAEIRSTFGEPWRTGVDDGRKTWTYGHYRYSIFGKAETRDLVVRFDDSGRVHSYTFNSTHPEDRDL
jgi:outer membrane protein assembly factor BamE (lipoprotein component of BamABCDE complex)